MDQGYSVPPPNWDPASPHHHRVQRPPQVLVHLSSLIWTVAVMAVQRPEACTDGALILTDLDSGGNGGDTDACTGGALILTDLDNGNFFGFLFVPIATYPHSAT